MNIFFSKYDWTFLDGICMFVFMYVCRPYVILFYGFLNFPGSIDCNNMKKLWHLPHVQTLRGCDFATARHAPLSPNVTFYFYFLSAQLMNLARYNYGIILILISDASKIRCQYHTCTRLCTVFPIGISQDWRRKYFTGYVKVKLESHVRYCKLHILTRYWILRTLV